MKKPVKNLSESYNKPKDFEGRQYTGMAIGRTHHWNYDKADWKEWEFAYSTMKRRTGHAPEGSGVPVGTGYHWFIIAHQFVEKQNANDYTTQMVGLKLKLAHKRADKGKWNASANSRRKELVEALENIIKDLKKHPEQLTPVPLEFEHKGKKYSGGGVPILNTCEGGICHELDITLDKKHIGIIRQIEGKWKMTEAKSQSLANAIGDAIEEYYNGAKKKNSKASR